MLSGSSIKELVLCSSTTWVPGCVKAKAVRKVSAGAKPGAVGTPTAQNQHIQVRQGFHLDIGRRSTQRIRPIERRLVHGGSTAKSFLVRRFLGRRRIVNAGFVQLLNKTDRPHRFLEAEKKKKAGLFGRLFGGRAA